MLLFFAAGTAGLLSREGVNFPHKNTIQKRIWRLFALIVMIGLIGVVTASLSVKKVAEHDLATANTQTAELVSSSLHAVLATQESVLTMLANELYDNGTEKHKNEITKLFKNFHNINTSIAGLGLLTPEGGYRFVSETIDPSNLPNLLEQPESRDSFREALRKDHAVLGRTYFYKPLGKWVIPIRKAIKDKHGKVHAVIASALDLGDTSKFFNESFQPRKGKTIRILREFDSYIQYSPAEKIDDSIYNKPISPKNLESLHNEIKVKYNLSERNIKSSGMTFLIRHEFDGVDSITSARYDDHFQLWTTVSSPYSKVTFWGLIATGIFFCIYLIVMMTFFFLFKKIVKSENTIRESLQVQANTDSLTGLANRNYLRHKFDEWLHDGAKPFSLIYIDMDNFKNVNDSYGHEFGDLVLKEIANRIIEKLQKSSKLIRHGGDEFLILTNIVDEETLMAETQELINDLSAPFFINGHHFVLGASAGIAKFPDHAKDQIALIRSADMAMYHSKKYRNKASMFVPGMEADQLRKIQIEQELRKAIDANQIYMAYQPQIDRQGRICGAEALVRWNSETLGSVPPDEFVPVAEQTGQISRLGERIMSLSFQDLKTINAECNYVPGLSVNVSAKQLLDPSFSAIFFGFIDTVGPGITVTAEITESLFIEELDYVLPILQNLHERGVLISMDDFGTGFSSLSMLKKLPLDEIKIDKSFVDDILTDNSAKMMVKNIIDIGKNLDLVVIAEGVESVEQKNLLDTLGCDRYQGYYYSRPISCEDFISFAKRQATKPTFTNECAAKVSG
jgi:diguanylate cyclase (GGDEF)-like protein